MTENTTTPKTLDPERNDWCVNPEYCLEGPGTHVQGPACTVGAPGSQFLAIKWALDESSTLAEAAQKARELADWLQGLADQGYVLEDQISDGHGCYYKPAK